MSEYAVLQAGGKQYRVSPGDVVDIDYFDAEAKEAFESRDVLLYHDGAKTLLGAPLLQNVLVKGEVMSQVRGSKVIAYKYKKRKNYRRKVGHRQDYTRIKITEVRHGT